MRTYVAGEAVILPVVFQDRGEPVIPEQGSVTYTLFDGSGAPVAGHVDVDVTTGPATVQVNLSLPGDVNTINTPFSKRSVLVRYTRGGLSYQVREFYRLVPFLNHTITPANVRSYLGVNQGELPDQDIDITKAYLAVQIEVGSDTLEAALGSGTESETKANDAILYRTVLDILPSLKLRVAQNETNGPVGFARPTIRDFRELQETAQSRLTEALNLIGGRAQSSFAFITTTQDADPITGA